MSVRINFLTPVARKNAKTQLHMEYVPHDDRINNPMKINIPDCPDSKDYIIVDAEAMMRACEKVLQLAKV